MTSGILSSVLYWLLLCRVKSLNPYFAINIKWSSCSVPAVLRLRDISLVQCVQECQRRGVCQAVNYRRVGLMCQLMSEVNVASPGHGKKENCVFIRKADFGQLASVTDDCKACDNDRAACDVDSGSCTVRECRKLEIDNALIRGNVPQVGSWAVVECLDLFDLDLLNGRLVCLEDGSWSKSPNCLPRTVICPTGWASVGTSCYLIPGLDTVMQYFDAKAYCNKQGGYILQLETQTESDAMKTYLLNNYGVANWWIGLSDVELEGNWIWATDRATSTFYDWISPSGPDGGRGANFARLENTAGWETVTRWQPCVVVCEKTPE